MAVEFLLTPGDSCQCLLNRRRVAQFPRTVNLGGVVERLMAPVLKTGRAQALVGSNPTPSAIQLRVADCGFGAASSAPRNMRTLRRVTTRRRHRRGNAPRYTFARTRSTAGSTE